MLTPAQTSFSTVKLQHPGRLRISKTQFSRTNVQYVTNVYSSRVTKVWFLLAFCLCKTMFGNGNVTHFHHSGVKVCVLCTMAYLYM